VVAHSEVLGEDFARGWRPLRKRLVVLHPGIDTRRFASVPVDGRPPRAGVFGHVSPTKRTDLALEIAARVAPEFPDFRLDIVGRAQYRDEDFAFERSLQSRVAADPRLREIVCFRGYAEDLPAAFANVSLLLHCRPDEPFGMVLIEAMAAGLPVVAPAAAGPLEIVEHGQTGLLYPPGDADAAAAHVRALLADPSRAAAIGRAAREAAQRRFSAEGHVRMLELTLAQLGGANRNLRFARKS
jgi:glycosyltransferase involved in cell wall biosynthesis